MKYYLSLGSNINAEENIAFAIKELNKVLSNVIISSTHKTKAEGFEGNDFINSVVGFETDLQLIELRDKLKQIEKKMGRTDIQKGMSDRIIDLDIILYGDQVVEDDDFDIPSKDIENYLFVLEPLAEIAGARHHPILNNTYSEMLKDLKAN